MADLQQQIQEQRQALLSAQRQTQELARAQQIPKSQLLAQQRRGIAGIAQTKAAAQLRKKIGREQSALVQAQVQKFETEVAQKVPEYATPQYKEKAYAEAKKVLQSRVSSVQERIESSIQAGKTDSPEQRDERAAEIRALQQELGVYKGALVGSKEAVIKGYYTGQTVAQASYQAEKVMVGYTSAEQRKAFAKQQGFSSFGAYQKAYKEYQKLIPPTAVPGVTSQVLAPSQVPGTYDPSTGIYVDPSGQGRSMLPGYVPPSGTKIISGVPSFLQPPVLPWEKPTAFVPPKVSEVPAFLAPPVLPWEKPSVLPREKPDIFIPYEISKVPDVAYIPGVPLTKDVKLPIKQYPLAVTIPTPIISDLEKPPTLKKFKEFFRERGLRDPITGVEVLAEDILETVTVPGDIIKEEKVKFIDEPSPVIGGTRVRRPVSFEDVDMGVLPPKQNFDLKVNKVLIDVSTGFISEGEAEKLLEESEKKYILDETKRIAAISALEGIAFGAISVLAPPVGLAIGGAALISGVSKRRQIIEFAKKNPKAAAIQFSTMIAGGIAGAKGVARIRVMKIQSPTVKLVGKGRQKFINEMVEKVEPDFKILQSKEKITGTRAYEIDIPVPGKDVKIKILEFEKDGIMKFFGETYINGKRKDILGGVTISSGKDGLTDMITKVVRAESKGKLTNLEISTFVERATTKASKVKDLRRVTLTESESKLSEQFKLKGLGVDKVREILRKPLFGEKESVRRKNQPFTELEFNLAKGLTKSEVVLGEIIKKIKLTKLHEQAGEVFRTRDILDIRTIEKAIGKEISRDPFKLEFKEFKVIFKDGRIKPVGKIPSPGKIKVLVEPPKPLVITKIPVKPKTPLEVTFAKVKEVPLVLKKLKPAPFGALVKLAKGIQKEQIKPSIPVEVLGVGIPTMVGGLGLKEIPFAGTGIYERAIGGVIPKETLIIKDIPRVDEGIIMRPLVYIKETDIIRPKEEIFPKLKLVEISRPIEELKPIERVVIIPRVVSKVGITPRVAPILRVTPRLVVEQKVIPRLTQPPRVPPRRVPRIPPPPIRPIPIRLPRKGTRFVPHLKKKKPLKKGFGIEIRRKGKWEREVLPHSFATKEGAKAKAMDLVMKEAAASFRIVKSKKPAKKSFRKPSAYQKIMFRPGKEPGVTVQKKLLRITTPGEVKEISLVGAAARRKKPRNVLTLTSGILKPKKKTTKKKKK